MRKNFISKQFYVTGAENEGLLRIASKKGLTQQQLFSNMVARILHEDFADRKPLRDIEPNSLQ